MKAVILAAGVGSRVRPLTDNTPKSLLKVGGKTILQRMIDNLLPLGINQVAIVTGYLEDQIKKFVAKTYPDLKIVYIKNELFDKTNTAYSLSLTKLFVKQDSFVKFDADVVFEKAILEKLLKSSYDTCLCIDKNISLAAEEVKVISDEHGRVLEVGKKIDLKRSSGESIGIEKFGQKAAKTLFEELEKLLKDPANFDEYYDDCYTTLVKKGVPFYAIDISGLKWVEIDTRQDFKEAQRLFSKN